MLTAPGSITTSWMGLLCVCGLIFAWLFIKYPEESPDAVDVVASELRNVRQAKGDKEEA